jgi:hypothetical protein
MLRWTWIVGVVAVLLTAGCDAVEAKVAREDITAATLHFTPDVAVANVDTWWYQFDAAGSDVVGCNSNDNLYQSTGWTFDEETQSVTVYFGSEYEDYTLTAEDESLESGRFTYSNSNGDVMEGNWERIFSRPCDSL